MKKLLVVLWLCASSLVVKAQGEEAQQLLLNVEKLAQFKKILQNMYDGYKILYKGYTAVKDISEGNFNLHKNFLDALFEVSPGVRKYQRIADIISYQVQIVKEYKAAFNRFKQEKQFTPDEIAHLVKIYGALLKQTTKSVDELLMVITAGKLRMSDDERLQAVDRIYTAVVEQFSFLKEFNNNTALLALQRKAEQANVDVSRKIAGVR
ncbi:MAG: TerB family tellurite resistance protein [Williamsia sp.]|nr:TerB family tellurite resistance protein [Williamsia sp.]